MELVLLHGFPFDSSMWSVPGAITPDQRGFGGTPLGDAPPSLDVVADDVAALLDTRGLDRVVLGGLSMGGYVAMAFPRRHPSRVGALLLADTKMTADPPEAAANRERIAAAVTAAGSSELLVGELLPKLVGETTRNTRPDVEFRVRSMVGSAPVESVAWAQRAMAVRPDSSETLAGVRVPALVVVGAEDVMSPLADAEAMAGTIPGARLVVLPGAGHMSAMETPAAFAAALDDFRTGMSARPGV